MSSDSAFDMLSRPDINALSFAELAPELKSFDPRTLGRIEIEGQYSAQLHRQAHDIRVFMQDESFVLSPEIDFSVIHGLSYELKERLREVRPMTIVSWPRSTFGSEGRFLTDFL